MKAFSVIVPEGPDEAVEALARWGPEARVMAGGTDLMVELKEGKRAPAVIVDIGGLGQLRGVRVERRTTPERAGTDDEPGCVSEGDIVWIGALTTHQEIATSSVVRAAGPLLADACARIGSPQIRAKGTVGGNLCTASPAGDIAPPLFCLEATIDVMSPDGIRSVDMESFVVGPKRTVLAPDEMVLGVRFRALGPRHVSFFRKLGQRRALAISIVSAALVARRSSCGVFEDARVAFGAVAPTVVRARTVEKALCGRRLDAAATRHVSRLAFRDIVPITDVRGSQEYRREMACNLLYEGLLGLLDEPGEVENPREVRSS